MSGAYRQYPIINLFVINCNLKSYLLAVQWFNGQEKVEKSDNVKSVKTGNTFKLEFKAVTASDAGQYTVKVIKDKKAIAKYSASLNIEPPTV